MPNKHMHESDNEASQHERIGTEEIVTSVSDLAELGGEQPTYVPPPSTSDLSASLSRSPTATASSLETWCYMSPDEQWQGPFTVEQLRVWRNVLTMNMWLCRATSQSGTLQDGPLMM